MRAYIAAFGVPLLLILLSVPLILGAVSRNRVYGFRTRNTLASDAAWYPANRLGGIALVCSSLMWLIAGAMLVSEPNGYRSVLGIGVAATAVAMIAAMTYAARIRA